MTLGADIMNDGLGSVLADKRKKVISKYGIDVNTLPTKEELDERTRVEALKKVKLQKQEAWSTWNLYPAHQKIQFDFSKWKPDMQEDSENAKELGKKAYLLAKRTKNETLNVLFVGAPGTGKTSLALAIAKELGKHTLFISTAELAALFDTDLKNSPDVKQKLRNVENAMIGIDVLIIDDLGTEGSMRFKNYGVTEKMQHLMYRVANGRFDFDNNKVARTTLITTNNSDDELN
ncbi:AAA family ATPase, partial [Liquorilactobacillus hordei]|uniref:AAA family ATPase n=2 Tax=Liquorilactobacillus hordei TaxID=468911 RepID=UPI0039E7966F